MKTLLAKLSLTMPSLVLAVTALITVPALADQGSGDQPSPPSAVSPATGDTSGSHSTSDSHDSASTSHNTTTSETSGAGKAEMETETEARHQGVLLLAEMRNSNKEHTAEQRKSACEAHKGDLATNFTHITTSLTEYNSRVAGILVKAQTYQRTNNVIVATWDSLVAAATAAGTTSTNSIAALKALTPPLDCSSASVTQDVATFKAAVQQAQTNLKAYKTAVRAVVAALQGVKQTTTGGQQ